MAYQPVDAIFRFAFNNGLQRCVHANSCYLFEAGMPVAVVLKAAAWILLSPVSETRKYLHSTYWSQTR